MTKHHANRSQQRGSAPRIQPQPQTTRRFTAPARVAAERAHVSDELMQFPSEVVEESAPPAPTPRPALRSVPAPPTPARVPQPPSTYTIRLGTRSVIWLSVAIAVGASVIWGMSSFSGAPAASAPPLLASSRVAAADGTNSLPTVLAMPVRHVRSLAVAKPATPPSPPVQLAAARPVQRPAPAPARPATQPAASVATSGVFLGSLAIASEPAGARVFVNGRAVGVTPIELSDLSAGSRVVRIEADGYQAWSSAVRVVADQQTRVSATLQRSATP